MAQTHRKRVRAALNASSDGCWCSWELLMVAGLQTGFTAGEMGQLNTADRNPATSINLSGVFIFSLICYFIGQTWAKCSPGATYVKAFYSSQQNLKKLCNSCRWPILFYEKELNTDWLQRHWVCCSSSVDAMFPTLLSCTRRKTSTHPLNIIKLFINTPTYCLTCCFYFVWKNDILLTSSCRCSHSIM